MKKVINFTKLRYLMLAVSLLLIAGGITGTISQGGFNLGIDFRAGLSQRVQIAPEALEITSEGSALVHVIGKELTLEIPGEEGPVNYAFPFDEYLTLKDLATAISAVEGVAIELNAPGYTKTSSLIGLNFETDLAEGPVTVNMIVPAQEPSVKIEDIRGSLAELGAPQIQVVGNPVNQEFLIRVEDADELKDFSHVMAVRVEDLLEEAFGIKRVIIKQTDYVGARFAGELGTQSVTLGAIALALILVYIWFRFKLAYAVSSIVALLHDVLIMLGFIGTLQLEVSTATIAAVLTIIGYSLNDTIVIFDRVRENVSLMSDSEFKTVVNTSISQSLGRTIITSLTTLLAVGAIYVFGTGTIKIFALNLIVGILIGTYSSIFVASPILLGWTRISRKHRAKKDAEKFGKRSEVVQEAATSEKLAEEKKTMIIPQAERKLKGKRKKRK